MCKLIIRDFESTDTLQKQHHDRQRHEAYPVPSPASTYRCVSPAPRSSQTAADRRWAP
jgi:hypothetical protein